MTKVTTEIFYTRQEQVQKLKTIQSSVTFTARALCGHNKCIYNLQNENTPQVITAQLQLTSVLINECEVMKDS